jgi:hypothetical protein
LFDAAVGGATTGDGVAVDEEEAEVEEGLAAMGTGGVSDLLREGTAAGSLGTAGAVEGEGWNDRLDNNIIITLWYNIICNISQ